MKNLQGLVFWTRIGLGAIFIVAILAELGMGIMAIGKHFAFLDDNASMRVWIDVIGISLIIVELVLSRVIYLRKIKDIKLLDRLELKLKLFGQIYSMQLLLLVLSGITALFTYSVTEEVLWFLPWMIVLYMMGKNFPFKLTLFHAMGIEDEEERELFEMKQSEIIA